MPSADPPWGPDNPHPLSRCKTELIWEGKYDEYGSRRALQLPHFPLVMQKIETIDAPRDHAETHGCCLTRLLSERRRRPISRARSTGGLRS